MVIEVREPGGLPAEGPSEPVVKFARRHGEAYWADSASLMATLDGDTIDLIVTSPPFGLTRKKEYGNAAADEYVAWFRPFAEQFHRILSPTGSLVIDIGGSWNPGLPTKSLYQYELLIDLCRTFGFHLAQEFFWWNPSRLPTPAEWVNIRRVRVKDAVNSIFWLSKTPWPKASNRRVLTEYSDAMLDMLANGYKAKKRPSGHEISEKFNKNNGAAIPPNLIAVANTDSNSRYLRYCAEHGFPQHPARFPSTIPEFFIRFLTDPGDLVLDPFAGSCVTGEVAERLGRRWICSELEEAYLEGAVGRFIEDQEFATTSNGHKPVTYRIQKPGFLWDSLACEPLDAQGGRSRHRPKIDQNEGSLLPLTEHPDEE